MESLSSYNSIRMVDVKARPERSSSSAPESKSARFPDPLAGPQDAAQSDGNVGKYERTEKPADDVAPEKNVQDAKRSEVETDPSEEAQASMIQVKTQEDDERVVTLPGGESEPDPDTVPSGEFGEQVLGEQELAQDLPAEGMAQTKTPAPPTEGEEAIQPAIVQAPIGGVEAQVQVAVESGQVPGAVAAQAAVAKPSAVSSDSATAALETDVTSTTDAAVEKAPASDSDTPGDFAQADTEVPSGEVLPATEPIAAPTIDAAIQDARVAAIAMNSRPVIQQPVQPVQVQVATPTTFSTLPMATSEAILNQIQARMEPAMNRAILRLRPESLGRVAVEVIVENGEVRAEMRVESAESLQAIQKYIPELKAMFAQADMELSELNLLLDSDGSGFDWEEETPDDQQTWVSRNAAQETNSEAPTGAQSHRLSPLEGGLDLIA